MKTVKWSQEQLAEISAMQEQFSLTRKSAVQRFRRSMKKQMQTGPLLVSACAQTAGTAPAREKVAAHKPVVTPKQKPATAVEPAKQSNRKPAWAVAHMEKCAAMYAKGNGKTVSQIAVHFGDKNKQNRVRAALRLAGVYNTGR